MLMISDMYLYDLSISNYFISDSIASAYGSLIKKCFFSENGPEDLDHAVLAVGWGTLDGKPYWIVKNSWSTHWGSVGFVLMSRQDNNCGVTTDATYVEVEKI